MDRDLAKVRVVIKSIQGLLKVIQWLTDHNRNWWAETYDNGWCIEVAEIDDEKTGEIISQIGNRNYGSG